MQQSLIDGCMVRLKRLLFMWPTGEIPLRPPEGPRALEASPAIVLDVKKTVYGTEGEEKEVRLEDEFRDAVLNADELEWLKQVRL